MKPAKKILAFTFIISIIGLLNESLAVFDIERTSLLFETIKWMNYVSPPLDLSYSNNIFFGISLEEYNFSNNAIFNYLNAAFYIFLFLSGIVYGFSRGKKSKILKFCFCTFFTANGYIDRFYNTC